MIDTIISQLEGVKKKGNGYTSLCPAHDDRSPSLSIAEGDDGRILLFCHAGCSVNQVCESLGLSVSQLFPDGRKMTPAKRRENKAADRVRRLERKYEILERWAFVAMCDFRDRTRELFEIHGVDIPDDLVPTVHLLPIVEHYIEILATGDSEDKLQLLREGVLIKWARLYSPNMTCQLSRQPL